ncbi:MAG: DUF4139 domain-containing protein [Mailhella sp.]|nr:DUF4139 domain-containing protein [Mailhella sp.]
MKRMPLLSALLPLFCLALSVQAEARPVAATLYPAGAMVTEEAEAIPADGRIVLQLPAGADAASLSVSLSRGGVLSRTLTLLPGQPSPAVKALQKEADALRDSITLKHGELASVSAMRSFWSQPPYSLSAPSLEMLNGLMEKLSQDSARQMASIAEKESALRAEIRELERRASALDARIRALGKQNADVNQCVLSVDGTGSGPVDVRWSYWLEGANWKPQYRVSADSASGQVRIAMQAELAQNSGMDWNGVELSLASSNRLYSVEPPALRPWMIAQNDNAAPRVMMGGRNAVMKAEAAAPASADEAGLAWTLGRMDLPASSTVTKLVGMHELESKFSRLLRPRQSENIWLYAALDEDALAAKPSLLLPSGQASFLVDGRETARGAFSFGPASRDIFFGIDQLMKAEVIQTAAQNDAPPAFFGGDKSDARVEQWSWVSTIHNGHDKAVSLRVEESAPIARDADVKLSVSTSPKAGLEAGKSRYIWELSLPAREKAELRYEVKAVIPEKK